MTDVQRKLERTGEIVKDVASNSGKRYDRSMRGACEDGDVGEVRASAANCMGAGKHGKLGIGIRGVSLPGGE